MLSERFSNHTTPSKFGFGRVTFSQAKSHNCLKFEESRPGLQSYLRSCLAVGHFQYMLLVGSLTFTYGELMAVSCYVKSPGQNYKASLPTIHSL